MRTQKELNEKTMNSNLSKAQSLEELLQTCPVNQIIGDNLIRAWSKINSPIYKKDCMFNIGRFR